MAMFRPEVQAKEIQFTFCSHPSLHDHEVDWVMLDPSRLLQITVNLITNAIKFTQSSPKREISVHIAMSTEQPDLQHRGFQYVPTRTSLLNVTAGEEWGKGELLFIRVKVEDTGCGLTPAEKQLLFERFAQASPRTHAHYGGSGLGLFISRQLAERHGGQIGVMSEAGVGSTFGFFIQARRTIPPGSPSVASAHTVASMAAKEDAEDKSTRAMSVAAATLAMTPEATTSSASVSTDSYFPSLHILIVEDNIVNQRVLSKQLVKAGCIVSTADHGLHALSHLAKTSFQNPNGIPLSVILMDLEMPEMDGLTCVGRIRELEQQGVVKGHVPVIAVTANVRDEQKRVAISSGMDDVVSKPFRVPELLAKIQDVLRRLNGK
jgi:CheY-like chemotaxis protein